MNNSRNIPWLRIFVEGTAVVLSILLAFAIDAWWSERLDRISERQELLRLQSEFEENRDHNPSSTGTAQSKAKTATLQIYELLIGAADNDIDYIEVPDLLLADMLAAPTLDLLTPVLDSLIRSGRIEIIQNSEILTEIATWQRMVQNNSEVEQRARKFVDEHLLAAVMDAGSVSHILLNQYGPAQVAALDPNGLTSLSVDERLIELVAFRYFLTGRSIVTRERIGRASERVLAAIADSLDN